MNMYATLYTETSIFYKYSHRHIPEGSILHSHRRETLKSYIALTSWSLQLRSIVSPVRYELGFYIPEGGNLPSDRRETLKSYIIQYPGEPS
jgi:hypothetical protein